MLGSVALVRTDVSEDLSSSIIMARCEEMRRLLIRANVIPSSPIHIILMKEMLSSSETSVLTRATRRNIPEDILLHSHRSENLKSFMYKLLVGKPEGERPLGRRRRRWRDNIKVDLIEMGWDGVD
jgi:hypothetical protein